MCWWGYFRRRWTDGCYLRRSSVIQPKEGFLGYLYPGISISGGFPHDALVKNLPANAEDARDVVSIPWLGPSLGVQNGNPLQYSCLENSMDRGAWQASVHGVAKSQTWLSMQTTSLEIVSVTLTSLLVSQSVSSVTQSCLTLWILFYNNSGKCLFWFKKLGDKYKLGWFHTINLLLAESKLG